MPFVDAVPRRRMPAAKRRELILAAAEDVFARSGYHGASLDEIAGAGGISKALIYEHFDSKRELRACLLEAHTAELFGRLQASAEAGATGEERLRGGIEAFLGFVEERRAAWRALFRDAADPEVAERIQGVRAQAAALIAELIATDPETPDSGAAGSDPRRRQYIEMLAQLLSEQILAIDDVAGCSPGGCSRWPTGGTTTRTCRAARSWITPRPSRGSGSSACATQRARRGTDRPATLPSRDIQ